MALKWPADWIIINIGGGADWLRICKTKYFFLGCGMIKFWYGIHLQVWPEPYIYGVCTVFLAGKPTNIRSYMVYIYGSGQPYTFTVHTPYGFGQPYTLTKHCCRIRVCHCQGVNPAIQTITTPYTASYPLAVSRH